MPGVLAVLEGEKDVNDFFKDQHGIQEGDDEMALELYQGKIEDEDSRPSSRSETPENKQKAKAEMN